MSAPFATPALRRLFGEVTKRNEFSMDLTKPEYDRITVWLQTQKFYADKPRGSSIVYRQAEAPAAHVPSNIVLEQVTRISVPQRDCIDVAVDMHSRWLKPLLLNMADWDGAGGSVDVGSAAQEEELFRRSDYHKSLLQEYYPLAAFDTIYTPGVEFFRRGFRDGYVLMDQPVRIDCVAAPALRMPQVDRATGRYANPADVETMRGKIRMLFEIAHRHGHDSLVLSAWGCGAFGCPPVHTAEIFREVCAEYAGEFCEIAFAVLGPNWAPFAAVLEAGASGDAN